jgi:Kef-type K+ transport system membrane component KefB
MVLSPILSRIFRLPTSVVEILLGSLAVWVGFLHVENEVFKNISKIGFFYLMFLVGLEIDIREFLNFKERFLKKSLIFFVILYGVSVLMYLSFNLSPVYIVALPIASLGMVMALINEHGKSHRWLELVLVIGLIGELISICAFIVFDGVMTHGFGWYFAKSIAILILVLASSYYLFKLLNILFWWYPGLKKIIMPQIDTKHQSIRISIALFFGLLAVMQWLEIDMVLGAIIAGIFIANFFSHKKELTHELSSFGFGFLVPLFFIFVGTTLDLNLVFTEVILYQALWIVLAMLGIRLLASFIAFHTHLGTKGTLLFSLAYSMPLTFLVAIATIAVKNGAIGQEEYASFIVAALMEGIIFMTLIQILMALFSYFEAKNKEKIR